MKWICILQLVYLKNVIRKEIRDMSDKEWTEYKTTFNKMKDRGYLADIAKLHIDVDAYAHKNGRFLPWHRMLLLRMESLLQMISKNPNISIPYWDWTLDAEDPNDSFIFTEKYWGINECYKLTHPNNHCLIRNEKSIDPFYTSNDMNRLIKTKSTYDEFRDVLELVPHAIVHLNVGGTHGDMSKMFSPNDPIFWHHHSYIDYVWYKKQKQGLKNAYGGYIGNKKLKKTERLYPFSKKVKDVLSLSDCDITYKPFKYMKAQVHKVVKPSVLSKQYIEFHGYDEERVREYEKFMRGEHKKTIWRKIYEWITGKHQIV